MIYLLIYLSNYKLRVINSDENYVYKIFAFKFYRIPKLLTKNHFHLILMDRNSVSIFIVHQEIEI